MIECRGKNGWFKYGEKSVLVSYTQDEVFVSLHSTRRGKIAPVMITGSAEEVRALLRGLLDELEERVAEKAQRLEAANA